MAKKRRKTRPRRPAPLPPAAEREVSPTADKQPRKQAPPAAPRPRKPIEEERPQAPWGSFPLVELVVAVGLVMLVAGLFVGGPRGTVLLATGMALGALAGLELSVREHFGGYRSHTALLAGFAAVAVLALLFYGFPDLLSPTARVGVAGFVGLLAAFGLARAFRSRAGRIVKLR